MRARALALALRCSAAGLAYKCWIDLSDQLPLNFAAMHATVVREREEMLAAGVDVGMIDRFAQNLPPRVKMAERGAFAWGIIAFKKPEAGHEGGPGGGEEGRGLQAHHARDGEGRRPDRRR